MRRSAIAGMSALFLLVARAGEPCRCNPDRPDFWQLAAQAQVVVVAQVTRHLSATSPSESAFEARIIEVVKGTEQRNVLTFPAPLENTCSVGVYGFPVGSTHAFILPARAFSQCMDVSIPLDENFTIEQLKARLAGRPMPPMAIRNVPLPPPAPIPTPTPTPRPPTPAYGVIRPTSERGSASCPCGPDDPDFWQLARKAPVVVVARVTKVSIASPTGWAFEARVIAVVKGTETRTTLTFPAPHEANPCAVSALGFPAGKAYAFILPPDDPSGFRLCRPRWLRLDGAKNDPSDLTLEIDQLRALLATPFNR